VIHDQYLRGDLSGFQLEPELLLQSRKDGGSAAIGSRDAVVSTRWREIVGIPFQGKVVVASETGHVLHWPVHLRLQPPHKGDEHKLARKLSDSAGPAPTVGYFHALDFRAPWRDHKRVAGEILYLSMDLQFESFGQQAPAA